MNINIISVYNDAKLIEQMRRTVEKTRKNYSVLYTLIDNRDNRSFQSAAAAYNFSIGRNSAAEVLVFCHQDLLFLEGAIDTIYRLCVNNRNTLYGAAGVRNVGHGGGNRIISSMAMIQEGCNYNSLEKGSTQDVFTLDECLIAGSIELFENLRFDDKVCDGWHLYAAELSLQCHVKGYDVKVFDANIVHLSGGNQDKTFYQCERKLVNKYRDRFPLISYTCGWAYTDPVRYGLLTLYRKIRYHI